MSKLGNYNIFKFRLLERVPEGVQPMLRELENHITQAGLADMIAAADIITQDSEKYVERLLELFRSVFFRLSRLFY